MDDTTMANGYKHGRPEGRDVKPADEIVRKVIEALPAETRLYPDVYAWQVTDALEAATSAPAVDREALIQVALRRSDNENHEELCSCSLWPADCSTYGNRRPWSHDGERLVEIVLDDLFASGILRDVRDVQAEALEQAADDVEPLGYATVTNILRMRAQAIREARSER